MNPITSLLLLLVLATSGPSTQPTSTFSAIDGHYQSIRLALLQDSTDGVREHADAIAKAARALQTTPTAAKSGVQDADLDAVTELLPQVVARATTLSTASDIGPQREALKKLTQPLVRWHEKLTGERPRVAYCPMERGAWLQPDGELGNPYGGTRMPRCGSFVTK